MDTEIENKNQEQPQQPAEQSQGHNDASGYQQGGYHKEYRSVSGRRPRIHTQRPYNPNHSDNDEGGFRPEGFGAGLQSGDHGQRQQGGYRPRFNNNGNNYRPRNNYGGDRQQGGYQPRPQGGYRPRFNADGEQQQGGYQPRQQGGYRPRYNNDGQQGGYQPRPQGGFRPRYNNDGEQPQGGYQPRQQGGFRPRYNNDGQQGGYQPRQQGGYRQGGYNRGGYQQGGYQPRGGYRPRTADYDPNAKYSLKKRIEYAETHIDPNAPIRLNKYLANAGVCSRREADEFIGAGVVTVNGEVVTELGTKVMRTDVVKFHDQTVSLEKKVYVLLNKPKDCVTTSDDPQQRKTVMDIVKDVCPERIYPVGRLDRNTTGVLLLTNDGDLASKLTHPKFLKKKVYHVFLDKNVTAHDLQQIADGIELEDGEVHADAIEYADATDKSQVGIEIHSGKNRIVRRIFEHLGYRVVKLDRVQFAGLTKKNLRRGDWRFLTQKEVEMLQMGAFE